MQRSNSIIPELKNSKINFSIKGFIFALFLTSGYFKADPRLSWINLDITLLNAIVLVLTLIFYLFCNGRIHRSINWTVILLVLCAIPILWTTWSPYAIEKVTRMFTLTALSMVSPFILFRRRQDVANFLYSFTLIGIVICIDATLKLFTAEEILRLTNSSASTNGMGTISAVTGISVFIMAMQSKWTNRLPLIFLFFVIVLAMLGAGSRAEILGFTVAVFILMVIRYYKQLRIYKVVIALSMIYFTIFALSDFIPNSSIIRVLAFFTANENISTIAEDSMRPMFWSKAITYIVTNPFGVGWGGFEMVWTGGYASTEIIRYFPHNLLLESFLEGGWLVGMWVLTMFFCALQHLASDTRNRVDVEPAILLGIIIVLLLSSLISGEWNDSRILFAFVSLALISRDNENVNYRLQPK